MKNWLVATYKITETKRLENNLLNQDFEYYLPKITKKKINARVNEEALFPGYIFINTSFENYSSLKYTIGIKNIIKFGYHISSISNDEIKAMQLLEKKTKVDPACSKIQIGQDVIIANGSFKGSLVKICSLPSKERVGVLLSLLGSERRVFISEKDIIY